MKLVVALIRPFKLEEVKHALSNIGLTGMIATEARGFGHHKGHTEIFRGSEYSVDFLPKVKIEVVVTDGNADAAIAAVVKSARTGKIGDGKIFVAGVEQAVRIRTEEKDEEAI